MLQTARNLFPALLAAPTGTHTAGFAAWACSALLAMLIIAAKPAAVSSAEPTNAEEAAAKKAAADKAVDEQYQQWKATLPPEHQAWETTLEQCLGTY